MLASDVAGTLPESAAATPSEPNLYGTIVIWMPDSRSISATKCGVLPAPAVDPSMPPLFAFAT